eukprot:5758793-Amphidinium_carterae.1
MVDHESCSGLPFAVFVVCVRACARVRPNAVPMPHMARECERYSEETFVTSVTMIKSHGEPRSIKTVSLHD